MLLWTLSGAAGGVRTVGAASDKSGDAIFHVFRRAAVVVISHLYCDLLCHHRRGEERG